MKGRCSPTTGGYGPRLKSNEEAIQFIMRAIEAAGLRPGDDVCLALDVASSHFYSEGSYRAHGQSGGNSRPTR